MKYQNVTFKKITCGKKYNSISYIFTFYMSNCIFLISKQKDSDNIKKIIPYPSYSKNIHFIEVN